MMSKTLTLRLDDHEEELLFQVMEIMNCKAATKAICNLLAQYVPDRSELKQLKSDHRDLLRAHNDLNELIFERDELNKKISFIAKQVTLDDF